MLLAATSGRNGTAGSRASTVRTPISRARRSAAGRDHANFAMNCSPTAALEECHTGSHSVVSPGIVMEQPLSSGITTRSAAPSASAEHSASHFIPESLPPHDSRTGGHAIASA